MQQSLEFSPQVVIDFWFDEAIKQQWFAATVELDQTIKSSFESYWQAAVAGKLDDWAKKPLGLMALIVIYDQFARNMFRGQAKLYSMSDRAIALTKQALHNQWFDAMPPEWQQICLMPLMHSENLPDHDLAIETAQQQGLSTQWFEHHRSIIQKFKRFPHRNAILRRQSTAEEIDYLNSPEAFSA